MPYHETAFSFLLLLAGKQLHSSAMTSGTLLVYDVLHIYENKKLMHSAVKWQFVRSSAAASVYKQCVPCGSWPIGLQHRCCYF